MKYFFNTLFFIFIINLFFTINITHSRVIVEETIVEPVNPSGFMRSPIAIKGRFMNGYYLDQSSAGETVIIKKTLNRVGRIGIAIVAVLGGALVMGGASVAMKNSTLRETVGSLFALGAGAVALSACFDDEDVSVVMNDRPVGYRVIKRTTYY